MQTNTPILNLNYNFTFADLYNNQKLQQLDKTFLHYLAIAPDLLEKLIDYRENKPIYSKEIGNFLLEISPYVEDFIANLFNIQTDLESLRKAHSDLAPLYTVKRLFVQRKSSVYAKEIDSVDLEKTKSLLQIEIDKLNLNFTLPNTALNLSPEHKIYNLKDINSDLFFEVCFSYAVQNWQAQESGQNTEKLNLALKYSAKAMDYYKNNTNKYSGVLFKQAQKLDFSNLLHHVKSFEQHNTNIQAIDLSHLRQRSSNTRQAFALTDEVFNLFGGLDEANYCIHCHNQGKDSCSKGLLEKTSTPDNIQYKHSIFGVKLAGCPLEEKISEFHAAKTQNLPLAALAIICIDNPMAAATGHRICNDCMKSCIYQKQTPVDIPQAETQTLKAILNLPWGFEIYSLLTRWNPLNLNRPYPLPSTNKNVLIVGLGPAGYTLAHHLMNDGHIVVGIDGLKIEPLEAKLCGKDENGLNTDFVPVYDFHSLLEDLDKRSPAGFGGVAEYGITVRWDKNFLKIIRLLLERRKEFALFGGVRFGSSITKENAFAMGFDHIALAMGAGRPTILDIPNGLAKGVRTASDFLMSLQLSGAGKFDSIANMQLRLPAIVIGGGLTAIDTATESMSYYVVQVEKFALRYNTLRQTYSHEQISANWNEEEKIIANEFLTHATAINQEKILAQKEHREANIIQLLQMWGGVTVAYRKRLIDSPAYILNHEEVQKALEEGIFFAENLSPEAITIDEYKNCQSMQFAKYHIDKESNTFKIEKQINLPAKSIFIAAGTQPNTVLSKEDDITFKLDGKYFQAINELGEKVKPQYASSKTKQAHVLLHKTTDNKFISFFGDLHPSYFGNVVKAMGSAKQGYPVVSKVLAQIDTDAKNPKISIDIINNLNKILRAKVHDVIRLTHNIIEIIVHAPLASHEFKPGQFYRLQNFESFAKYDEKYETKLAMEGLALTGAWVDKQQGLISCIALEMGGSSNLCAYLQKGESIILMGPTGMPTHIESNETVMLVGGGLGNAVLFSIGAAFRASGSKVLYFAGYKKLEDRYKIDEIQQAADTIIWCCDENSFEINPNRKQDKTFHGNIVQAILNYANGSLGDISINTLDVNRIIAIGSDRMMAAVAGARHNILQPYLKANHFAIGSINSPMQCMMKEICAQCLQPHIKEDGSIEYVFSCFNQDQDLDKVDFNTLNNRLNQNTLSEKLTKNWLQECLK